MLRLANKKSDLIRQFVNCLLSRIKQTSPEFSHRSSHDELQDLFAAYGKSFPPFSQTAQFDLKLHCSKGLDDQSIDFHEKQWKRIAAAIEAGIARGLFHPIDINLVRTMMDGMFLSPFLQDHLSLSELVDILMFGIARRAP